MALILLSFLGGVLTILSPCVLPLLPIIIGGSLTNDEEKHDRWRPVIITMSLALSIVIFTLALKWSTAFIAVPPRTWSIISGTLVVGLGIITLFPTLWEKFALKLKLSERSNKALATSSQKKSRGGAVLVGLSLGPVFSSCSPTYALILATVLPQSFFVGTVNLLAYALGLSLVLLLIAVFGQRLVQKLKWAADPEGWFKKALGVLFIIVGILILLGLDKQLETALVERGFGITDLEMRLVEDVATDEEMDVDESSFISPDFMPEESTTTESGVALNVANPVPAPELAGVGPWINSDALTLEELEGKVVLVDFWTYSCINCIRTIPFLNEWHDKYADDGLVILGVHAPEFAFEKEEANVRDAVEEYDIEYPVTLDNDFTTWRAYNNRYWPAKYFIDRQGRLRHYHFGEGEYEESEEVIRTLLAESGEELEDDMADHGDANNAPVSQAQTPETYLGYKRYDNFANKSDAARDEEAEYTAAEELSSGEWTLDGNWAIEDERIVAGADAKLTINVDAKDVYLVLDSEEPADVSVLYFSDELQFEPYAFTVDGPSLYDILRAPEFLESTTIEFTVPEGVAAHAFTFGS